jgi:hypothetical protein
LNSGVKRNLMSDFKKVQGKPAESLFSENNPEEPKSK